MLQFDLKDFGGLSEDEAKKRLISEGFNELPSTKKRNIFLIAFEIIKEPMFLLLVGCGILYLLLGDIKEALLLLGFVFVVMGITFYQERKTERALEALRDLSSPRALVIRNKKQLRIPGREVVRGDNILLSEGDRVPADAVVLHSLNLSADESLLTGESVPVRKNFWEDRNSLPDKIGLPGGDDLPFVFSGSLIVQGQGIAQVLSTGINTEIGKIGKALQTVEEEDTFLKLETVKLVKTISLLGLTLCLIVIVLFGLTRGNWIHAFLAGLTLAMAVLPEEFPVVLTIFLALGAWRISKKNVLTRKIPAVEALGAASVLCVDKTGTITQNKMEISRFFAQGKFYNLNRQEKFPLPEEFHELVEYGILASQKNPFDPMEKALRGLGELKLANTEHLHYEWELVQEYPLSKEILAMSNVWKSKDGGKYIISSKGAPEAILDLCHLKENENKNLMKAVEELSKDGLRVIGVASAMFDIKILPLNQHDYDFKFIGFVGFADPIRQTVPTAIKECYKAGIKVVMITGDYPGTAQNIAKQIGLKNYKNYITGQELTQLNDEELKERIRDVNIFCRVVPEQKLRIVQAFKSLNEIVAMTGDGVNDAPALKAANIGIAMGNRGTDVAREASSIVLLDDDFSSIVGAIKMGRRIFDNIKKAMSYIFAIHVPIAGLALLPLLFDKELILLPVHIVFLELIIDPACSVVFEAESEEEGIDSRPPRAINEPLFGKINVTLSMLQGIGVFIVLSFVYFISLDKGLGESGARTLTFTTLIVANLALILTNRSWNKSSFSIILKKNSAFILMLIGVTLFLILSLTVPFFISLFKFQQMNWINILLAALAGMFSITWFEVYKIFMNKHQTTLQ
jgi:Ca2+-transporting ATPase